MDEAKQLALFDYGTLDLDTRSFVQTKTAEIRILVKQTAQGIIEIGQRLIEVKERLVHGGFLPWLESEFNWSDKTARRFMDVARSFKLDNLSNLEIGSSALYLLAASSVPEEARTEALTLAESGERITHQKAQELVAKYKAEAEEARRDKQQTITTLEDQIKALEADRTRLRTENDRALRTKSADDACIIRQEENYRARLADIEKLNQQIEELKALADPDGLMVCDLGTLWPVGDAAGGMRGGSS